MKDTPTPRTDAAVKASDGQWSFVLRDECQQLERELTEMEEQCESWANQSMSWKLKADVLSRQLEELKEWQTLAMWGGTPMHVHEFIKGQQARIRAAQDAEEQLELWQKLALSAAKLRKKAEEQRDRLAVAMRDIRNRALDETIGLHPDADAKGCVDDCLEWAESALAALKGGADE
jgi:hypothetical protein